MMAGERPSLSHRQQYRKLLDSAHSECPAPTPETKQKAQRGRQARSKSRNLLERLLRFEDDVLRFMSDADVPFSNNQGENDIRMTKVQQKISGCFRSFDGATHFCRTRSYLSSCRKQNISATLALSQLFIGKLPGIFRNRAE